MSFGSENWAKWVLNEDQALPLLKAAWDAGIQTWDTADGYSNVTEIKGILTGIGYIGNTHWQSYCKI
jgi:aryl-alcohol dehydrogenase-like predicted oxidoreductase